MDVQLMGIQVGREKENELLMFHHLRIASMLFEGTGINLLERIPQEFSSPAFRAFVEASEALYPED